MTDIEFATRLIALAGTDPAAVGSRTVVTDIEDTLMGVYIYADYERAIEVAREIHSRKYVQHTSRS
jgi:aspartate kinase